MSMEVQSQLCYQLLAGESFMLAAFHRYLITEMYTTG